MEVDLPEITQLLWDDAQGRTRESIQPEEAGLYRAAFEQIRRDPNSQLFVAECNEAAIGCLQMTVVPGLSYRGIRRALVEDVRVARAHRGKGIGRLLLAHAETVARSQECRMIELFVHESRTDAHLFYESVGYTGAHRGFRKSLE